MANQERKAENITNDDSTTAAASAEQPATNLVIIGDTVPVCIKLCEPICADSRYEIGIDIFERPVAKITSWPHQVLQLPREAVSHGLPQPCHQRPRPATMELGRYHTRLKRLLPNSVKQ